MSVTTRTMTIAAGSAALVALAAPALATTSTPTSLNLRAAKATVAARHGDTLTARLSAHGKGLAGQTLVVQERTAPTTSHKTTWTSQAVTVTDKGNGVYTFTVTPPIAGTKKVQKDQYRVLFTKTATYGSSHSQVITVTVKRAG